MRGEPKLVLQLQAVFGLDVEAHFNLVHRFHFRDCDEEAVRIPGKENIGDGEVILPGFPIHPEVSGPVFHGAPVVPALSPEIMPSGICKVEGLAEAQEDSLVRGPGIDGKEGGFACESDSPDACDFPGLGSKNLQARKEEVSCHRIDRRLEDRGIEGQWKTVDPALGLLAG